MIREKLARVSARKYHAHLRLEGLPIGMMDVCAALGYDVSWDRRVIKADAVTIRYEDNFGIFLPERLPVATRLRFTLAHELGHIAIGHFEEYDLRMSTCSELTRGLAWTLNREANIFAEEFLMPAAYIKREAWRSERFLCRACGVSLEALRIRFATLEIQPPQGGVGVL